MGYDVDYDYQFEESETGLPILPEGVRYKGNLLVLPNGRYLPSGAYRTKNGGGLIYEPHELSPFAEMLAEIRANGDEADEDEEWGEWEEEGE